VNIRPVGVFSAVLVTLAMLAAGTAAASASTAKTRPEMGPIPVPVSSPVPWPHAHHGDKWYTCTPQATRHVGIYQDDNDRFSTNSDRSCITASPDGTSITIDSNYQPHGGSVVAYPAVRIGDYPWNRDPGSGLPEAIRKVRLTLRLRNTGTAPGSWIDDLDIWFGRPSTPLLHIREIVVITRSHDWAGGGRLVRVGHRRFYLDEWETGADGRHWPLIRFVARTPTSRLTPSVAAFIRAAHRWVRGNMVLSSVSDGSECWSGCKGLTDGMRVVKGLP
jgi:hypothetical protein